MAGTCHPPFIRKCATTPHHVKKEVTTQVTNNYHLRGREEINLCADVHPLFQRCRRCTRSASERDGDSIFLFFFSFHLLGEIARRDSRGMSPFAQYKYMHILYIYINVIKIEESAAAKTGIEDTSEPRSRDYRHP